MSGWRVTFWDHRAARAGASCLVTIDVTDDVHQETASGIAWKELEKRFGADPEYDVNTDFAILRSERR